MAKMLAHEVKNPLSGIRGAAQLIEQNSSNEDKTLTKLICDETDRICTLVDKIDMFSNNYPLDKTAVNIHEVLNRVRDISKLGFATTEMIYEDYDPSLPNVDGNFDQLVQAFLNLFKNAVEAAKGIDGEIRISTTYQQGIYIKIPGTSRSKNLPLVVSIQDNGVGVPLEQQNQIFDVFFTTKNGGSGLGLAITANIIGFHNGVIEFDSKPGHTVFRILLPVCEV